jgi:predicted O-methyltransferase YrrM
MKNSSQDVQRRQFLQLAAGLAGAAVVSRATDGWAAAPAASTRPALEKLLPELEAQDDKMMLVNRQDGMFVHILARLAKARRILELGTAHGYWTLWLATAGPALITTVEIKPDRLERARQNIARAGFAKQITFLAGDAHGLISTLKGPFDFIFLNADKSGLMDYFKKLQPHLLAPGALLLTANAIKRRDDMKVFLETLQQHPEYDSVVLSATMDDGFSVALRR